MEAEEGDIADIFLFEVLKGCVDPSTLTVLKAYAIKCPTCRLKSPGNTWNESSYDPVGARLKEWKRVALKGGELTLAT